MFRSKGKSKYTKLYVCHKHLAIKMANRIETFDDHASYKESVKDITDSLSKLDLDTPEVNILRENSTTMELLKMQSHNKNSQTYGQDGL